VSQGEVLRRMSFVRGSVSSAYVPLSPRVQNNLSMASFIKWMPRPCADRVADWDRILVPDRDDHGPIAAFAAATEVNQLAGVQAIAVEHRVTQGFPKLRVVQSVPEPGVKRWYRVRYHRSCAANAVSPVGSGCSRNSLPTALSRNTRHLVAIFCDTRIHRPAASIFGFLGHDVHVHGRRLAEEAVHS
jgi:hypothetical protein